MNNANKRTTNDLPVKPNKRTRAEPQFNTYFDPDGKDLSDIIGEYIAVKIHEQI